jgi:hypothetical protein
MVNHLLLDTRCPICRHDSSKRERANDEERAHEDEERAHGDEDILEDREEFDTRSEALSNRILLLGSVALTFVIACFNIVQATGSSY